MGHFPGIQQSAVSSLFHRCITLDITVLPNCTRTWTKPGGNTVLRSWKSSDIVVESHGKVIEFNIKALFLCCFPAFLCPLGLRATVTETDEAPGFDVKYHLLQMKHSFHSRRQLRQVQSWRCLQFHVGTRLSCQSWFRSHSLFHTQTHWSRRSFIYLIIHTLNQSENVIITDASWQSNNVEGQLKTDPKMYIQLPLSRNQNPEKLKTYF